MQIFIELKRVPATGGAMEIGTRADKQIVNATFRFRQFRNDANVVVPRDHRNHIEIVAAPVKAVGGRMVAEASEINTLIAKASFRFPALKYGAQISVPRPVKASFRMRQLHTTSDILVPTAVAVSFGFRQFKANAKINIPPIEVTPVFRFRQFLNGAAIEVPTAVYVSTRMRQFALVADVRQRQQLEAFFSFRQFRFGADVNVPEREDGVKATFRFGQFTMSAEINVPLPTIRRRRITTIVR